jgi:hypothetical protein
MQITKTLCDHDYGRGKEVTEGVTTVNFSLGKKQYEADLCPPCAEALTKAMEPFINDGRRAGRAQTPVAAPSSSPAPQNDGDFPCPDPTCSRAFSTAQGLSMHQRRTHGTLKGSPGRGEKVPA